MNLGRSELFECGNMLCRAVSHIMLEIVLRIDFAIPSMYLSLVTFATIDAEAIEYESASP